ncbi:MAG: 4Fe-4S binding protein [Desulfovibrionaceae bacterium]|nr:4Fe-4S binding protein [Desulfovibrionaceae bacterium]
MKQLVVVSGKGGTGKTSLTAALAGLGPKKVLADCDVDAADLHLVLHPEVLEKQDFYSGELPVRDPDRCTSCGLCLEHCRFGAISEDFRILPEHCEGCAVCAFVCPTGAVEMRRRHCGFQYRSKTRFGTMIHAELGTGQENSGKLVTSVRNAAMEQAQAEGADLVLVDGSPGVGCPVIASLTNTDAAVFVAEPTVSAIHDLKRVHALAKYFKIPGLAIINKTGINPGLEEEIRAFCAAEDIPVAGALPYDMAVTKAQILGQTIVEYDPNGLGRLVQDIWDTIAANL